MKRHFHFLMQVFLHSITAFGGPQNHLLQMQKRFCERHNYLSKEELFELNAFCNILPGPTSTQVLSAIAFKRGRLLLSIISLLIWIMPATIFFLCIVLLMNYFNNRSISLHFLHFMQPMALGFLTFSGYKMIRSVINTGNAVAIMIIAFVVTLFVKSAFTFPSIFLVSIIISNFRHDDLPPYQFKMKLKWGNIIAFIGIELLAALAGDFTTRQYINWHKPFVLFENFYRFGAITFGGGQLLVPVLFEQFVLHKNYFSATDYLTGVGLVQALPGPVFSIATFAGGMAMHEFGKIHEVLGCMIGMVGIFLPGFLLLIFLFPIWNELRKHSFIKRGLAGINAATVGFVIAASYIMFKEMPFDVKNIAIMTATFALLLIEKIPTPLIALMCLVAGIFIQ